MFGADLNLPDFLSDELEQLFVVGAYEDVTFAYLALKMMRKVSRKVNSDNWHSIYEKECRKRDYDSCSKSLMDYEAKERVALLKNICEWILDDCEKKGIEGIKTAHRIEPIGEDKEKNRYWHFWDHRVYTDKAQKFSFQRYFDGEEKTHEPVDWKLVCSTREEWQQYPDTLKNTLPKSIHKYFKEVQEEAMKELQERAQMVKKRRREWERKQQQLLMPVIEDDTPLIRKSSRLQAREKRVTFDGMDVMEEEENLNLRRSKRRTNDEKDFENTENTEENENNHQEMERDEELKEIQEETEDWNFDCFCREEKPNTNVPLVSCEKCNIWRHIICVNESLNLKKSWELPDWSTTDYVCEKCKDVDIIN